MKIENISIQNFKTFGLEKIKFSFNDLTSLIGENSVGKSNVLEALDLFFNFTKTKISTKSYHHNDYSQPIVITVKFKNLNKDELTTFKAHLDDCKHALVRTAHFSKASSNCFSRNFSHLALTPLKDKQVP